MATASSPGATRHALRPLPSQTSGPNTRRHPSDCCYPHGSARRRPSKPDETSPPERTKQRRRRGSRVASNRQSGCRSALARWPRSSPTAGSDTCFAGVNESRYRARPRARKGRNRSAIRPNPSHRCIGTMSARASSPIGGSSSTVAVATRQKRRRPVGAGPLWRDISDPAVGLPRIVARGAEEGSPTNARNWPAMSIAPACATRFFPRSPTRHQPPRHLRSASKTDRAVLDRARGGARGDRGAMRGDRSRRRHRASCQSCASPRASARSPER